MFTRDDKSARISDEILPLEMGYLPEFFQKKARIELNDTPEMRKKNLTEIKELIKGERSLLDVHYEDDFLMLFLLTRKHDVLKAFKQLKTFTNFKRKYIETFTNPEFDTIVTGAKTKVITIFPWRCQDGCAIVLIAVANWDPSSFPFEELKKYFIVLFSQALLDPMTQVNGFKLIFDMNVNPIKHLKYCTPPALYMLYTGLQECLPGRFKEIHCINVNTAGRIVWFLAKSFISQKFQNRVFFHTKTEELLEFFPPAILPRELGGDLEDWDSSEWLRRVMQHERLKHSDFIVLTGEN